MTMKPQKLLSHLFHPQHLSPPRTTTSSIESHQKDIKSQLDELRKNQQAYQSEANKITAETNARIDQSSETKKKIQVS